MESDRSKKTDEQLDEEAARGLSGQGALVETMVRLRKSNECLTWVLIGLTVILVALTIALVVLAVPLAQRSH